MNTPTIIVAVILIFLVIGYFATTNAGKDIHPTMPILPNIDSEDLILEALPTIKTLQYMPKGNIHAFGQLPADTSLTAKKDFHLLVYDNNFELLDTKLIVKDRKYISFVDPASNVYIGEKDTIVQFSYPTYKKNVLLPHPISTSIEAILANMLNEKGARKEEYLQLKEAGKKDIIQENNQQVSQEFQAYCQQQLDLEAIDYGVACHYQYVLFMKDGNIYTLQNYRGDHLKKSIKNFLKDQEQVVIYNMLHRKDKGCSITNMRYLEQQKTTANDPNNQLLQTGFGKTETKTELENWPNGAYTKGFYYYELHLKGAKALFKATYLKTKKGPELYLLSQKQASTSFLSDKNDHWYSIQSK